MPSGPGTIETRCSGGAWCQTRTQSLVLKLRELAAGWRVAQGRHLMVPELSSGAPGAHHSSGKVDCRILLGFGRWRIFGALGGTQCVPSHSEVVFEIAGNRRSRKRPQSDLGHIGTPPARQRSARARIPKRIREYTFVENDAPLALRWTVLAP